MELIFDIYGAKKAAHEYVEKMIVDLDFPLDLEGRLVNHLILKRLATTQLLFAEVEDSEWWIPTSLRHRVDSLPPEVQWRIDSSLSRALRDFVINDRINGITIENISFTEEDMYLEV